MDDRPRNLRTMLAEAKDLSELMVDLAYGAVFFDDVDMAEEVVELEDDMNELAQDMRRICILAVRQPREAEGMSSVLRVVTAIERIGNDAVSIARIVTHKVGIPPQLLADLAEADEISHRVTVVAGSAMHNQTLATLQLPVATGTRVMAIKRNQIWITDIGGATVVGADDVLLVRGGPDGIAPVRSMAGAPVWEPAVSEDVWLSDLDRSVDVLVEMKDLSETAVGLAYSAMVMNDLRLAAEVRQLGARLNEMNDKLELWVLRAAKENIDPSPLRGLLQLAHAATDIAAEACEMVWIVEQGDEVHPILQIALGESDEVVMEIEVTANSRACNATLGDLRLNLEPGFIVLAIRRTGRYIYRPTGATMLVDGDVVIASGPEEGRAHLAKIFGWRMIDSDEPGIFELELEVELS